MMVSLRFYSTLICMVILLINHCNANNNFTNSDVTLPISALYSICAIWNNTLYVLNGQIGYNYTSSLYNYNKGLYTLNLLTFYNQNNTQWNYTESDQLPTINDYDWQFYSFGLYTPWQSYTQIGHLIYSIAPATAYSYDDHATALLIYDLSKQVWIDANTYSSYPSLHKKAVCVTNNNTHIFGIGGYISSSDLYNNNVGYSQIYNIKNNSWTLTSSMNITIFYSGCSYSHFTHYIYSFGGAISSINDTDIIMKYNQYTDSWSVSATRLPNSMVNLYCYEMQLKHNNNIYCMHGSPINEYDNPYDYIMKYDIIEESMVIVDHYDLSIPMSTNKYPVYGFMSALDINQNKQYSTLYLIAGGVGYNSNHYYFGTVQTKLLEDPTTIAPTSKPSVSPIISTLSPTLTTDISTYYPTNISYSTTEFPVVPPFFNTTEGTLTLIVIGLCIVVVIMGCIVYVKSESEVESLGGNKIQHKKEEYFNLPTDFDTFKL